MSSAIIINGLDYLEFLDNDELIYKFETDMENKNYQNWTILYPDNLITIFASIINFNGDNVTNEDIIYFKSKGLDLNISSDAYRSDAGGTTPLGSACEFRYSELIKLLIKHGCDVNLLDQNNFSPLESALMGHNLDDTYDVDACKI